MVMGGIYFKLWRKIPPFLTKIGIQSICVSVTVFWLCVCVTMRAWVRTCVHVCEFACAYVWIWACVFVCALVCRICYVLSAECIHCTLEGRKRGGWFTFLFWIQEMSGSVFEYVQTRSTCLLIHKEKNTISKASNAYRQSLPHISKKIVFSKIPRQDVTWIIFVDTCTHCSYATNILISFHFIHLFSYRVKQSLQSNKEIGENGLQGSLQRLYETYNSTMSVWQYGWLAIIYM